MFFLFFVLFIKTYAETNFIDLNKQLYFDYHNQNKIFVTNNQNGYNQKYYIQDKYIYSIEENMNNCLDTCLSWVNKKSPRNTIAITGFDIRYLDHTKCECKGQILKRQKKQYYPEIFNIDSYNDRYYYESNQSITINIEPNYIEDILYLTKETRCNIYLSNIAKKSNAEAITNFKIKCDRDYCICSCYLLYSY